MAGLAEKPYCIDGTEFQEGNTFEIAKNGTYQIAVSDSLGNVSVEEIEINNIDTSPPNLTLSLNPEKWKEGDCTITAVASDEGLGLGDAPYSFDGGKTWESKNSISVSKSCTVEVMVRDAAGNVTVKSAEAVLKEKKQEEEKKEKESGSEKKEDREKESEKENEKNSEKNSEQNSETEINRDDIKENDTGVDTGTGDTLVSKEEEAGKRKSSVKEDKKDEKGKKEKGKQEAKSNEERNPEDTETGENGQNEPETEELNIQDVQDEFSGILPEDKRNETTIVVQKEEPKAWENTKAGIILKELRFLFMKIPKEYRILGITSSTLTGFTGTFFGIFFLTRSAGVFWLDGKGKEHFLARNLIHRKGEMYTMKINRSALMNSESKNLRIRMPGVFVALHRYRPFVISMGNTTVSQNVEKIISVHLP